MSAEGANRTCLNCKRRLERLYCGHCGQKNVPLKVPVWQHFGEIVGEHLSLDSRMARTVLPFLCRPGFLTREFNEGRRARYSSPLRLYLLMSVMLFLGLSVSRFVADFVLVQQLSAAGDATISMPAAPGGGAPFGESASRAFESLTAALSTPPTRYEQSISNTIVEVFGEDHPLSMLVSKKMAKLKQMGWAEARLAGFDNWLNMVPTAMFLLLPFFATLLKVAFLGTGRYYAEHLVFTLHLHAFTYLVFLVLSWMWTPQVIATGLLVLVAYIFLGLRTAYRGNPVSTLVRGTLFLVMYLALLLAGLGATFWISLMML